ncbi:MAG: hypothetical protein LH615_13530, partial [Ferruginibacter sp.]|nr:hypothetical protein [Ferruginibacter sp.]
MRFFKYCSIFFLLLSGISHSLKAQDSTIVKWNNVAEKMSDGVYKIKFTGLIKKDWHIYSAPDAASEISGITVNKEDSAITLKELQILTPGTIKDDHVWAKKLQTVADSIVFTQLISIAGKVPAVLELKVNYEVGAEESFFPESDTLNIITGEKQVAVVSNRILIP